MLLLVFLKNTYALEWTGELGLQGQKHAPESGFSVLGSFNTHLKTKSQVKGFKKSNFQAELFTFYEPGKKGDYSIDADNLVYRVGIPKRAYFFVGRTHPMLEGKFQKEKISRRSAIGSVWTQNQTSALDPQVRGWIGAGTTFNLPSSLSMTFFYSPLFLPHFGPRLSLSESEAAQGSRYSRLPPQYVRINNQTLPLRYNLETGSLSDIIFQNQYFSQLRYRRKGLDFSLLAWSAPSPEPEVDTSGILRVTDTDLIAVATAVPRFERKNYFGFRGYFYKLYSKPDLEVLYEAKSKDKIFSFTNEPLSFLKLGFLNTWTSTQVDSAAASYTVASYSKLLGWIEFFLKKTKEKNAFEPSLKVEHHFVSGGQGTYLSPRLNYWVNKNLLVFTQLNLIMGSALSYYGNWRSLDSYYLGLKYLW